MVWSGMNNPNPAFMLSIILMTIAVPVAAQTVVAPQPVTPEDIVGKPLDDLNLRKDRGRITPALVAAQANPYAIPGKGSCAVLNHEVAALDAALGPDVDTDTTDTIAQKRARAVGGTARAMVGSLIPFDSLIRQISGANAAAGHRDRYLYAGSVRRAFLKGYARAKSCKINRFAQP